MAKQKYILHKKKKKNMQLPFQHLSISNILLKGADSRIRLPIYRNTFLFIIYGFNSPGNEDRTLCLFLYPLSHLYLNGFHLLPYYLPSVTSFLSPIFPFKHFDRGLYKLHILFILTRYLARFTHGYNTLWHFLFSLFFSFLQFRNS